MILGGWWSIPPEHFRSDQIRSESNVNTKQNRSERYPADIMAQQEAFQTHSHNQWRGILQWVIETSIKGSNILMGTEKEEMIPCSYRCFLIFLWSGGTFGEWQMLRWPVSPSGPYIILVSLSHILAYHQVRHRPPVQLTGWGALLNGLWVWASCPLRMCLLVICMYIFQLARGCCTIIFWILSRQSLNTALTKPNLRFRKFYRERKLKIYSTINWQNNRQT